MVAGRRYSGGAELSAAQSFFLKGEDAVDKNPSSNAAPDLSYLVRRRHSASLVSTSFSGSLPSGSFRLAPGEGLPIAAEAENLPAISAVTSFRRRSLVNRTPTPERTWMESLVTKQPNPPVVDKNNAGGTRSPPDLSAEPGSDVLLKKAAQSRAIYRQLSHVGSRVSSGNAPETERASPAEAHLPRLQVKTSHSQIRKRSSFTSPRTPSDPSPGSMRASSSGAPSPGASTPAASRPRTSFAAEPGGFSKSKSSVVRRSYQDDDDHRGRRIGRSTSFSERITKGKAQEDEKHVRKSGVVLKAREDVYKRRQMYGMAVTRYRPKPTHKTHVDIGRGILVPVKEVNNLRKYFEEMDLNGDGTIEPEEIRRKAKEAYRLKEMRAHGEISDEDWVSIKNRLEAVGLLNPVLINIAEMAPKVGHEALNWKALLQLAYPKASEEGLEGLLAVHEKQKEDAHLQATSNEMADLKALWSMWDADGSGELDPEEFRRALAMLNISAAEAETVYHSIDDDGNGFISLDEFARWWLTDNEEDREMIDLESASMQTLEHAKSKSMKDFFEDNWKFQLERLGLERS